MISAPLPIAAKGADVAETDQNHGGVLRIRGPLAADVSKYFNDPNSVSKKTRIAIEGALKKSGFRPNIFAVNLNRRRSNIIGIIVPDAIDPSIWR